MQVRRQRPFFTCPGIFQVMPTTEVRSQDAPSEATSTAARWADAPTAASDMPKRAVRHLCAEGELPAKKLGRAWRIPRRAVMPQAAEK